MKITIRFDGGCRPTNPGNKYGSYEVCLNGRQVVMMSRMELGWGTNNEAEFEIFEAALKWTRQQIMDAGNDPHDFDLEAFSDSMVVVNRINGEVKGGKKKGRNDASWRMADRAARCFNYTKLFASFKAHWNGRMNNVRLFGH